MAAFGGSGAIAELFIQNGAELNARNSDQETPLHVAASYGSLDMVRVLVASGVRINVRDGLGDTPLHSCVASDEYDTDLAIVKTLVENKADIRIQNTDGKTPLAVAEEEGLHPVVEYLDRVSLS